MGKTVTLKPPGENRKPPTRAEKPGGAGRALAKISAIVLGSITALLLGVLIWAMFGYNKIYPGIHAGEISLGGLTEEDARLTLELELSGVYDGASISLNVDGQSTKITAEEAGAGFSAESHARGAYEMGRVGNVFSRALFVASSPFASRDMGGSDEFYIDRAAVASRIKELSALVNSEPAQFSWEIKSSEILVRGGSPGRSLNEGALADLIVSRFLSRDFSDISTETALVEPEPLPLQSLYDSVRTEPKDAYLDTSNPAEPKIMPHVDGIGFDMEDARRRAGQGGDFSIPLVITPPALTQASLESRLFKDTLASFSTNLASSSSDRTDNIRLAASFINGTILLPGDVFSYNGTVGERTAERGFKGAGAYVNGRLVDEIGGGICQMSSTLYNAALLANLKIVERQNHSMTVAYLQSGRDATVNWGTIDFRFENNTAYPVQILASVEGKQVKTSIIGYRDSDYTVEIERDVLSSTPFQEITKVNDALAPGSKKVTVDGHSGAVVQTYRVVKDSLGNVVSRSAEAKSTYRKVDKVTELGPGLVPTGGPVGPSPSQEPAPSPSPSPSASPSPSPSAPDDPSPSPSGEPEPDPSPGSGEDDTGA